MDSEQPVKKKRSYMKWKILLTVVTVSFVVFSLVVLQLDKKEIINIEDYLSKEYESVSEKAIINDLGIDGGTLYFNRGGKRVELNIVALVNGSDLDVTSNLVWFKEQTGGGNWKYGANITIPNNPTGTFIANNLEEIRFDFHTENMTIEQLGGRIKHGFHYKDNCVVDRWVETCTYVEFDFKDIISYYQGLNLSINRRLERNGPHDGSIVFDVREINFNAGQVIFLDPTVTETTIGNSITINQNITQEGEGNFSHLSIDGSSNIVFYMPFDTNSDTVTTYDYLNESTNDGTINGATWTSAGKFGGGMAFDGTSPTSQEIVFDNFDVVNGLTEVTVCVWVYDAHGAGSSNNGIIGRANNPTRQFGLYRVSTEVFRFYVYEDDQTVDNSQSAVHNTAGEWLHVCGWYNGSLVDMYVNGVDEDASDDLLVNGALETTPTGTAEIGDAGALASASWNGTIDEVTIYDRALTPTEIADLYINQSARFYPEGTQLFRVIDPLKDPDHNRINVTIDASAYIPESAPFSSFGSFRVGTATGNDYSVNSLPYPPDIWWRFDNDSSLTPTSMKDYGTRSMNGTCTVGFCPGHLRSSSGFFEVGQFDDFESYTNALSFGDNEILGNMTILLWANKTESTTGDKLLFYGGGTVGVNEWTFGVDGTENIEFDCGGTADDGNIDAENNVWTHIGMTFNKDTNELNFYRNGEYLISHNNTGSCLGSGTTVRININTNADFEGEADEIMIWERILTAEEIKEVYVKGGFDYIYTDYVQIPAIDTTITIPQNTNYTLIDLKLTAGNGTYNPFISPNVVGLLDISTHGVAGGDTCTYSSGTWNIECADNCDITTNVSIDGGGVVSMTGTGTFTVRDGVVIENWVRRHAEASCYYLAEGTGGFYQ